MGCISFLILVAEAGKLVVRAETRLLRSFVNLEFLLSLCPIIILLDFGFHLHFYLLQKQAFSSDHLFAGFCC